jgi:TPR repeat protein
MRYFFIFLFLSSCQIVPYEDSSSYRKERVCINLFKSGNYGGVIDYCKKLRNNKKAAAIVAKIHRYGPVFWKNFAKEVKWLKEVENSNSKFRMATLYSYGFFGDWGHEKGVGYYYDAFLSYEDKYIINKKKDFEKLGINDSVSYLKESHKAEKYILQNFAKKVLKQNYDSKSYSLLKTYVESDIAKNYELNFLLAKSYSNFKYQDFSPNVKLSAEPFKYINKEFYYLKRAADLGHVNSKYLVGVRYLENYGVVNNYADAFRYFSDAADKGNIISARMKGMMQMYAVGTKTDYASAKKWLEVAADKNDLRALYYLAKLYETTEIPDVDYKKLCNLLVKAASLKVIKKQDSYIFSLMNLYAGKCYYNGVFQDNVGWSKGGYERSVDLGYIYKFNRSRSLQDRLNTKDTVMMALKYYQKSANQGNKNALKYWAHMLKGGRGVKEDLVGAYAIYLVLNNFTYEDSGIETIENQMSDDEKIKAREKAKLMWAKILKLNSSVFK